MRDFATHSAGRKRVLFLSPRQASSPTSGARLRDYREEHFDLIHLESLHLAGYLPAIRKFAGGALTVFDWHNIESELMRRFADTSRFFPKRAYAGFTAHRLEKLERMLLSDCFGHR